jgi:aquaporin Z
MNYRALVAEFIGTFTLIFVGVGSIAADFITGGSLGLVGIALAHGLAIGVMVSATMATSGGHLNPAVTIGLLSVSKIKVPLAIGYIVAQCLGGLVAALLIKLTIPADVLFQIQMGTPLLNYDEGITPLMGLGIEIILTFFLVFTVYGTAVDHRAHKVGGLFSGLAVAMGVMMGGPFTGAAMNPARHLGPSLIGGYCPEFWIYWVGPIVGGILAAQVYRAGMEMS